MGMKTETIEFHGSLQSKEFFDWLAAVKEILEFKDVLDDMYVPLVANRFHGRATTWWQKTKLTRHRLGKSKIVSYEKINKYLHETLLPYNFQQIMYQRLQNLKQSSRSIDDYTTEFYQLVAKNKIQETEKQLVVRYIGELQLQIQDMFNMFNHVSMSVAH